GARRRAAVSLSPARLLRSKTIEQAVAAGAAQVILAATAVGTARRMRRIPRMRRWIIAQAEAVNVSEHGAALGAARPVFSRTILTVREDAAVRFRARQCIVTGRCNTDTGDPAAVLGQRCVHGELIVIAVQIIDVLRDDLALEILPRTGADAVAGVDRCLAVAGLRAQVGAPGLVAGAGSGGHLLTVAIGPFEAAKIGAMPRSDAGHKERHVRRLWRLLLGVGGRHQAKRNCGTSERF